MMIGHTLADETGHLLAADPGVCEIMQREERELVGMSYRALTHPDDRAYNNAVLERLGRGDGPLTIRKRYVRPDGSIVWSDVQVSKMGEHAGRRLVGTIRLLDGKPAAHAPEDLWRSAKRVRMAIERRRAELGEQLFSDHCWVVLIETYLAEAEGRSLEVAQLSDAIGLRRPLLVRWIAVLAERGLIAAGIGRDRPALQLTAAGLARVEALLAADAIC